MFMYFVFRFFLTAAVLAFVILYCGGHIRKILAHFSHPDVTQSVLQLINFLFAVIALVVGIGFIPEVECTASREWSCLQIPGDPLNLLVTGVREASYILLGEALIVALMLIVVAGTYNRWLSRQRRVSDENEATISD